MKHSTKIGKIDVLGLKIENLNIDELEGADYWVIDKLNDTISEVTDYLDNYRINDAVKKTYEFFWHIFCDWYIEIVKNDFTQNKAKILLLCLVSSLKLIHPVMPFITEEIFQMLNEKFLLLKDDNIVKSRWPDKINMNRSQDGAEGIESLVDLVKGIRNLKVDLGIAPAKKVKALIRVDNDKKIILDRNIEWVVRLSNLEGVEFRSTLSKVLFKNDYLDLDFVFDDFDVESYISSLRNKIGRLEAFLDKSSRKLKNESFLSKASRETIDKEKEKYESGLTTISRLKKLRDALSG